MMGCVAYDAGRVVLVTCLATISLSDDQILSRVTSSKELVAKNMKQSKFHKAESNHQKQYARSRLRLHATALREWSIFPILNSKTGNGCQH